VEKPSILLGKDGKAIKPQASPRITVLIDGTVENSLYLSRCIEALLTRTNTKRLTTEFIVGLSQDDDWNRETVEFFQAYMKTIEFLIGYAPVLDFVAFAPEKDLSEGYIINQLAKLSRGEWILPLRASQVIRTPQWDERLIELVEGDPLDKLRKDPIGRPALNSASVATIKMDVQGVPEQSTGVAFAVSRGWYNSLGTVVKHSIAEDYISLVVDQIGDPNRSLFLDDIEIIDPEWGSLERSFPAKINESIDQDVQTLTARIKAGF